MPATVPLGRLQFDPHALVLYDGDEIVPLAPLPAHMLAALVRANGDVVSAAWMRKALWNDAPVEDRNLNQQMYVLRRALRRDPRVTIENVPRRGYRLVVAPPPAVVAPAITARTRRRSGWMVPALIACVAAIELIAVLWPAGGPEPGAAIADRDLTLANFLSTTEGPGHLERAALYYRDLAARVPGSSAAYGGLAVVDAKRALNLSADVPARERAFETAELEALMALRRNPKESNGMVALGIIAGARDHCLGTARHWFDAAVAADPASETPRFWRAKFLLGIGQFAAAGRDYEAMSANAPTSAYALGSLGEWLVLRGDYARAAAVLAQAVDLGNHPGFTRYWLARAYYLRGRDDDALRLSNVLLGMYPNEASALVIRLHVEARRGDMQAALADLHRIEQTRNVAQTDPVALAAAQLAMGSREEAVRTVRRYVSSGAVDLEEVARIRTDPDLASVRTAL